MSILVLAEKPSVAGPISTVLGAKQRGDGFFHGSGYIVSWCYGHLVELADPAAYGEQYKRWSRDSLPILPRDWQYKAAADKKKQLSVIRKLMNSPDVETVICATDSGREGELIFRLIYNYCKCNKPIQRLWISSLEDSAIREGFSKLRPGEDFDNLYRAALCRAQADYLVGLNATRLFSCLYGPTLNVGRVQTPTLAMIVEREKAIAGFVPEPFYMPEIDCGNFTASGQRYKDMESAEAVRTAAEGSDAVLLLVDKVSKTTASPRLYDLTSLQRDANRIFGFTAQQTLDYTQSLYEARRVTYPRTDSQFLTTDMADTAATVIAAVRGVFPFARELGFEPDISQVTDNSKCSEHHAIIPTIEISTTDLSALPSGERDILSLIAARLLCAAAPEHSYEAVTSVLGCGGYQYTVKGKTVLENGWKAVDAAFRASLKTGPGDDGFDDEEPCGETTALPELTVGQVLTGVTASIREGRTKPPARFTEGTLLRAMETAGAEVMPDESGLRKGLGTPATRAGIIEKLIRSDFVERQKKNLVPTAKAMNLIAVLPDEIASPALTADWEHSLRLVESGELSDKEFMSGIEALVMGLVAGHTAPIPEVASLFAAMPVSAKSGGNPADKSVGSCPRCGFAVIESARGFFCSSSACKFVLWKESRFWSAKGKALTAKIAGTLLKDGRVAFSDLNSERTGKTYAATVYLYDDGSKADYELEFEKAQKSGGAAA